MLTENIYVYTIQSTYRLCYTLFRVRGYLAPPIAVAMNHSLHHAPATYLEVTKYLLFGCIILRAAVLRITQKQSLVWLRGTGDSELRRKPTKDQNVEPSYPFWQKPETTMAHEDTGNRVRCNNRN